ncbi:tumor protein p53-inducible nuclear protein 2-like [Pollicipes pollicipes]|uniref:tumor protein p53-inducible nuclear protein 2-like n=1 Tax=Pollicipes pollicipes TaxID=41117 RepID=UPI0018850C57|nr:tumor protein p53-inducible nuclear protein 2-like [Pollicipes pollicipes]
MLGQLTGYLFGGAESPAPAAAAAAAAEPVAPCRELHLEDPELDEWVMVAEGASAATSPRITPACSTSPSTPTSQLTVDDNWTLTPPACFATTGRAPLPPASSLENLLIEHPSMSVYVRGCRPTPASATALREPAPHATRNAQKLLRPSVLERSNRARQVQAAGSQRPRRSHHYGTRHSGANNNRKC